MMNASYGGELFLGEGTSPMPSRVSRIAIADDDPDSLALLRQALASPTTEIREATNGVELAKLLIEDEPFALVITDVLMPWLEGLQILRSLRGAEDTTPVLLITGLTRPDLENTVDALSNARLLHKPFGISELRAAVFELTTGRQEAGDAALADVDAELEQLAVDSGRAPTDVGLGHPSDELPLRRLS